MKTNPIVYFWLTILILVLGILSRKASIIPLFFGDILYAVLIYFGLRFLLFNLPIKITALLALTFCFIIEVSQLFQTPWMIAIRKTTLGHYVLGQGFLWSDLLCYFVGIFIALNFDLKLLKTQNSL